MTSGRFSAFLTPKRDLLALGDTYMNRSSCNASCWFRWLPATYLYVHTSPCLMSMPGYGRKTLSLAQGSRYLSFLARQTACLPAS